MGIIRKRIEELKPRVERLKALAWECRYDWWELACEVETIFSVLKPFNTRRNSIRIPIDKENVLEYEVGRENVRRKMLYIYSGNAYVVNSKTLKNIEFVDAIREHGEEIASLVRKKIADEFAKLVALTKELAWTDIKVVRKGVFTFMLGIQEAGPFRYVCITADYPDQVLFYDEDPNISKKARGSVFIEDVVALEDLYDLIEDMLLELRKKVSEAKKRNEEILRKMKEVVAPYAVARACAL
ncbi:MAG: hypothetical protein DRP11_00975 [Candidatus Aenigmatarchaeota archaeon]|nr:MAG: hypothetical protein DRP11_00975 [Candidatus Aenigmarchaeota archaeon]